MRFKNFAKFKRESNVDTLNSRTKLKFKLFVLFKILFFILISVLIILIILNLKITKFDFVYDPRFFEYNNFKIFALNDLKDQNLFFYSKNNFEDQVKKAFPEIIDIKYEISSWDTLKVFFEASNICCIVSDINGIFFLISNDGKVLRKISIDSFNLQEVKFEYLGNLEMGYNLNSKVINRLNELALGNLNSEISLDKILFTFDKIVLNTKDGIEIVIDEETDLSKFKSQFLEIKKHLESSNKKYSSLDFRFEKVIVK